MRSLAPHYVLATLLGAILSLAPRAFAIINPSLQPSHLYDRYDVVLNLKIAAVDAEKKTVEMEVVQVCKGEFAPRKIEVALGGETVQEAFDLFARPKAVVVAYVGQKPPKRPNNVLFYPDCAGRWQVGTKDQKDPARWRWTEDVDPAVNGEGMAGTFNGAGERLAEMMADKALDQYYFPAIPAMQFGDDVAIAHLGKPIRGVALYDINGDGKLDVYACCDGGNKLYVQTTPLKFEDRTQATGLAGIVGTSCSFADVNADGTPDLLVDGSIYLQGPNGKFSKADLLPNGAGDKLKSSAFVEINGDGYPDVVISKIGGGLHVYLNPGAKGGVFTDATQSAGLADKQASPDGNGFFAPGDFNGDGRTDLFYAVGKGLLLAQGADGKFAAVFHDPDFDFTTDGKAEGLTGACCFAPLWRPDRLDLIATGQYRLHWVGKLGEALCDLMPYGNEIWEGTDSMLPVIAEDLNADGNVDIYAGSRAVHRNAIYGNRGYGSFTTPVLHKPGIFPGEANQRGAWGLAAGDAKGDGTNDLLLGGADGSLVLIPNNVLADRKPTENPTLAERVLARTKILTVHVRGKVGVLGAVVTLADDKGRVVGMRVIGSNVATGCRGPDTVNLAVRQPGAYTLTVRFSDGHVQRQPVDLTKEPHVTMTAARQGGQ
jgi:hypothetical protein